MRKVLQKSIDEDAWADIRAQRIDRLSKEKRIAYYAFLVGLENALNASKFVENAVEGRTPPRQFVKGYLPIIEMIDDIVNAGTAHIQRLRQVHKSAKNRRKQAFFSKKTK